MISLLSVLSLVVSVMMLSVVGFINLSCDFTLWKYKRARPHVREHRLAFIGSKCPGTSGTVPDLAALSLVPVPEDPSTSLLFVPDLRKTVVLTCYGFNNN